MKPNVDLNNRTGWVNFEMDSGTNQQLMESASRSGRTKRQEALLRLKDHLLRFHTISEVGEVKKKLK